MKLRYQFALAALVIALMTLTPSAVQASTPGVGHTHSIMFHDHTPHAHIHGSHTHRN
jgi:hypothetical protein